MSNQDRVSSTKDVIPLSGAASDSVKKLYNVGRFALISIGLSALILLFMLVWSERDLLWYAMGVLGLLLMSATGVVLYISIGPLMSARRYIHQNCDLLDMFQRTAVETADVAFELNSVASKRARRVDELVEGVSSKIAALPIAGKLGEEAFKSLSKLSHEISGLMADSEHAIGGIRIALAQPGPGNMNKSLAELGILRDAIKRLA